MLLSFACKCKFFVSKTVDYIYIDFVVLFKRKAIYFLTLKLISISYFDIEFNYWFNYV